MNKCNSI